MIRNGWHKTAFGEQYNHYFDNSHISLCHTKAIFYAITLEDNNNYTPKGYVCKKCKELLIKKKVDENGK